MNDNTTKRRRDWQSLQQKIGDVFIRLYRENQRQPTNAELAKEVSVSERTIVRHLATIDLADYFSEQRGILAVMAPNVMMAIYNSALKGSARAQKLILQIVFEWAEPKSFEQTEKTSEQATEAELADIERGIDTTARYAAEAERFRRKISKKRLTPPLPPPDDDCKQTITRRRIQNDNYSNRTIIAVTDGQYVQFSGRAYTWDDAPKVDTSSGVLKDGKYKVGVDFPAGEYKVTPNGDGYLAITTTASESIGSIVTNDNFNTEKYITVQDGQYLKLNRASLKLN